MRSRLTLCNVHYTKNPITQCTARLLVPAGGGGPSPYMVTAANTLPVVLLQRSLRLIGGGAVLSVGSKVGKSFSYQLLGDEVFIELSVLKSYAGKKPVRRHIYLRAQATLAQADISLRVGAGEVQIAQGPFQILTSNEASAAFGNHFKDVRMFTPKDATALALRLTGQQVKEAIREVPTVNESGHETTVAVRRRRRIIEI